MPAMPSDPIHALSDGDTMLKYPCLVLDHDDTVVQSEATVNYPYFVILGIVLTALILVLRHRKKKVKKDNTP